MAFLLYLIVELAGRADFCPYYLLLIVKYHGDYYAIHYTDLIF